MKRRPSESGYALLLVFAMAAAVAIMLYMELPRLVFESRRITEQELIYRGEQYQRAIQLYVRKFNKYPATLDDLETTSNLRFLRRRYEDPMTDQEEWRLIHIDAAGMYTDSLIHKLQEEDEEKAENTFITEGAAFGSTGPPPGQTEGQEGAAGVRGASDRPAVSVGAGQFGGIQGGGTQPYSPGTPPAPGQAVPGSMPPQPGAYGQQPPYQQPPYQQPGAIRGQPYPYPRPNPNAPVGTMPYMVPGQPIPQQQPQPGQYQPGIVPGQLFPSPQRQPGSPQPNPNVQIGLGQYIPTQPSAFPRQQPGQQQPNPYQGRGIPGLPGPYGQSRQQPTAPQYPGYPGNPPLTQPGSGTRLPGQSATGAGAQAPGQPGNPAMNLIRSILITPRPGGLSGLQAGAGTQGQTIGGGIAGVASTLEAEGIMIYNERTKYNEWEFLYDYREEQASRGAAAARGAGVGGARNPLGSSQGRKSSFGAPGQSRPFSGSPTQPPPPPRGGRR